VELRLAGALAMAALGVLPAAPGSFRSAAARPKEGRFSFGVASNGVPNGLPIVALKGCWSRCKR